MVEWSWRPPATASGSASYLAIRGGHQLRMATHFRTCRHSSRASREYFPSDSRSVGSLQLVRVLEIKPILWRSAEVARQTHGCIYRDGRFPFTMALIRFIGTRKARANSD
jgi:hypothetical protein